MSLPGSIKDHIMIGGPNAVAGWGLFALLVVSQVIREFRLVVDPALFISVLLAAILTGNGIYALNAYYDSVADKINKPNRPIPSGRITPEHAMRYAKVLFALGMLISVIVSVAFGKYLIMVLWSLFTIIGIAYSTPPVKLKKHHICGNLAFGSFCALALFIGTTLRERPLDILTILSSTFYIILISGLITMKDFYDTEGDRAAGDITLPVKVGKKRAAAISIVLMIIPMVLWTLMWPPANILEFIQSYFWIFIYITSFGVYIALDYIREHSIFSDSYARVQYYFIVLLVAYQFLQRPLGLRSEIVTFWERPIILGLYAIISSVAVYGSWKARRDILKPGVKGTA